MKPVLIQTTDEVDGVQWYIYRSVFPIKFSVKEGKREIDITLSDEPLRGKEVDALLQTFGFVRGLEIRTEQTKNAHIIFCQPLLVVDTAHDSVVKYSETAFGEDFDMCCRYYIDDTADELLPYFEAAVQSPLTAKLVAKLGKALKTKGEVRPTDMVTGIALNSRGVVKTFPMVWGYSVQGAKGPVFNARSETAGEKPMFKDGWENRRCIIPSSYFFEWGYPSESDEGNTAGKGKTKFVIQPKGETVTWLAGIYRLEENGGLRFPVFSILTKAAIGQMSTIHDRMPVIFRKEQIPEWLAPSGDPAKMIRLAVNDLVVEKAVS